MIVPLFGLVRKITWLKKKDLDEIYWVREFQIAASNTLGDMSFCFDFSATDIRGMKVPSESYHLRTSVFRRRVSETNFLKPLLRWLEGSILDMRWPEGWGTRAQTQIWSTIKALFLAIFFIYFFLLLLLSNGRHLITVDFSHTTHGIEIFVTHDNSNQKYSVNMTRKSTVTK